MQETKIFNTMHWCLHISFPWRKCWAVDWQIYVNCPNTCTQCSRSLGKSQLEEIRHSGEILHSTRGGRFCIVAALDSPWQSKIAFGHIVPRYCWYVCSRRIQQWAEFSDTRLTDSYAPPSLFWAQSLSSNIVRSKCCPAEWPWPLRNAPHFRFIDDMLLAIIFVALKGRFLFCLRRGRDIYLGLEKLGERKVETLLVKKLIGDRSKHFRRLSPSFEISDVSSIKTVLDVVMIWSGKREKEHYETKRINLVV